MVISSLNTKLLEDRLGYITKSVGKLKAIASLPEERFLIGDNPAAAESYLRRCLEAVFDIGRHIIAKTAGKAEVEYKEVVTRLREIGASLRRTRKISSLWQATGIGSCTSTTKSLRPNCIRSFRTTSAI